MSLITKARVMAVQILLIAEPSMVRDGVRALLESVDDFVLWGVATDGSEAMRAAADVRLDVVVIQVRSPGVDGLPTAESFAGQRDDDAPGVVLVADAASTGEVIRAARLGIAGYLLKGDDTRTLVAAIRAVAAGHAWLSPTVARQLLDHCRAMPVAPARPDTTPRLSGRERSVVRLVADGRSNAEIAEQLVLSHSTVKTHVSRILAKLELRDRVQIAAYAYQNRLT